MAQGNLSEDEEFELLSLQREKAGIPAQTFQQQMPGIAQQAGQAALASSPANLTKNLFQTDPATMQRVGGGALPIMGGFYGGGPGAMVGEALRQETGRALAPDTVPKTPLRRLASTISAGVMQEPEILNAIPGVPKVAEMAGNLVSKTGRGLAKASQAFSGGKAGDFIETAAKGAKTYKAPSMAEAQSTFGNALAGLPGESIAPTMAETMKSAITPEASAGTQHLMDLAKRIDTGELIDARQALKAKQSLDDVIDTVPIWQTKRRGTLFAIKKTFDDVLSSQSGEMKTASNTYRAAILKDNMTKFLPVNKHGEYSRLAPMLTGLASTLGGTVGAAEGGKKGGILGGLAPLAAMVALSPGTLGLGAAGIGGASRAFNAIGQNPVARQALFQVLQRINAAKAQQGQPQ